MVFQNHEKTLPIEASGVQSQDRGLEETINVGGQLRKMRIEQGYSIRGLAEKSGLNVNTLSMIENGKSSPSVSTLQQLAKALSVTITAFFEGETKDQKIVFQSAGGRQKVAFAHGTLEDLGSTMTLMGGQPLLMALEPNANSGPRLIVHTGMEFVFCLEGMLKYTVDGHTYLLNPNDSLLFEAYLPHRWENASEQVTRSLLILCPSDERDRPTERHFAGE